MRARSLPKSILLAVGIFGLCLGADLYGQAKPSPLLKLDRNELTAPEKEMLPDITVALTRPAEAGGQVWSMTFSRDGQLVTGNRDGKAMLWDLTGTKPKLQQTLELEPAMKAVGPVGFSPDGKQLVAVQADPFVKPMGEKTSTLTVFDMTAEGAQTFVRYDMSIGPSLAFHPARADLFYVGYRENHGRAVSITGGGLTTLPYEFPGAHGGFAFTPDGGTFASIVFNAARNGPLYGSEIKFWKVTPAAATETALIRLETGFKTIAFSPDGKWMATGSLDKVVRIWDLSVKQPVEKAKFLVEHWPRSVYFAGGSNYVVCVSSMNQIVLYNIAADKIEKAWMLEPRRGSELAEGAMYRSIAASALAPDGLHLAISNHNARSMILRLPITAKE